MDLSVSLAGLKLQHPLFNAAGTCKLLDGKEGVRELARTETAAITVGSGTMLDRAGNSGSVYWIGPHNSLNSLGLNNPGLEGERGYKAVLPEMVKVANGAGKPLFFSAAGFTPEEYARLVTVALEAGVDLVEINLGCPNLWEGGTQKKIMSFDIDLIGLTLVGVRRAVGNSIPIAVKLSPYSDPAILEQVAKIFLNHPAVKAIFTTNTFPNSFAYKDGKPAIDPGGGLAGFAGPGLKAISLGQVVQFRNLLPDMDIVGIGGITCGQDVNDYIKAGATACALATQYLEEGGAVFGRIMAEYAELVGETV